MPQSGLTARQIAELPKPRGRPQLVSRNPALSWPELTVRADLAVVPLRFLIATGARRKEARQVRWREVDLTAGVWIIPTERMKGRQPHRVPLSVAARAMCCARPR